jgi:hypothetical protein
MVVFGQDTRAIEVPCAADSPPFAGYVASFLGVPSRMSFGQLTGKKDVLLNPLTVGFVFYGTAQLDTVTDEFNGRRFVPNRSAPIAETIAS